MVMKMYSSLQWCNNGCGSISNHQLLDCLLNCLFRRRSKKTSNSTSLAFVRGIHWWPVDSPHKGPVTRKMFPFDDFIMAEVGCQPWWLPSQCWLRYHGRNGVMEAGLQADKVRIHRIYLSKLLETPQEWVSYCNPLARSWDQRPISI